jgi:CRISPR/Cas system-associated exonuclease Cas4 (RecB family)
MQEDLTIDNSFIAINPSGDDRSQNKPIAIAQSYLNNWQICARKFQHTHINNLAAPISSELEERLQLGQRFHLLMQQHELGLEVNALADHANNPNLPKWLARAQLWLAQLQQTMPGDYHSEHRRTLGIAIDRHLPQDRQDQQMYMLNAVYDLVIFGNGFAQIIDWKTHQKPLTAVSLRESWQTRLYLYLLAATTAYTPDQIKMTYWFANGIEPITLSYDQAQQEQTQADLSRILAEINTAQANHHFPQLELGSETCQKCDFAYRCDRAPFESMADLDLRSEPNSSPDTSLPTKLIEYPAQLANRLAQIPEIEI